MNILYLFPAECGKSTSVFDTSCLPSGQGTTDELKLILSVVFGIVGALAFLMVVIGGFRYIISDGDPQSMSRAKNTIIYALVGLALAVTAEAIVAFVVGKVGGS